MEIEYDPHARLRMAEKSIREEHVRFVLEHGVFVRPTGDRLGEILQARILERTIVVALEVRPETEYMFDQCGNVENEVAVFANG